MYNRLTRFSLRITRLVGFRYYLNNYFPLYARLTHFRIRVELYTAATWA